MNQREILFRAKRVDTLEWVEGFFLQRISLGKLISYIQKGIHNDIYEVIPETVSQYTGVKDKNGVKIFEGDKVRILYTDWTSKSASIGEIVFHECEFCVKIYSNKYEDFDYSSIFPGKHGYIEVIGNIFEEK